MAELRRARKGLWKLHGELDFDSAAELRPRLQEALRDETAVDLDLSGVTRANSAGLALLLQWQEDAARKDTTLTILRPPAALLELAGLSNLHPLLALRDARAPSPIED